MERDERGDGFPDAPSPRVGGDTEENGEAGDGTEADAQLAEVAGGAPDHAKGLVLVLAAVLNAHGEGAAVVADVGEGAALVGDLDDAELAAAVEAIVDDDLVVDDVGVVDDEPGWAAAVSTYAEAEGQRPGTDQSGRWTERMFWEGAGRG